MTPRQYNEMMRQAEVLEKDKLNREFHDLWEQFRDENPNSNDCFMEQYKSFQWLWSKIKENDKSTK